MISYIIKSLGLWKLEDEYIFSVFLGPKLYGCLNIEGKSYSKVKGFKKTLNLEILSKLLEIGKTEELRQTKWFKYINESKIHVKDNDYKLSVTDLKRNLIYNNQKLVDTSNIKIKGTTKPYKFENICIYTYID